MTLRVDPGVTGLLGPNGSGKSTLIKSLLGLVKTQQGRGSVLGIPWPEQDRAIRDLVGYLPEDDCYIAGLNGIESVAFMANLSGLPGTEGLRRAHEVCDFCDISEERYRPVESYSTGMRQKLKFAQALVHDPPFLILDEPTTGLDPNQREAMLSRIRTLSAKLGKSVLLSTHILHDVRSVCDQVIMLVDGSVKIIDTLDNLSRPSEPTIHLSLMGDPTDFIERLRNDGFSINQEIDGSLKVVGVHLDQTTQLWTAAAATDTRIRRMEPARNALEQIFFDAASKGKVK
ncbi:ABC transporter ATP-binding protein [Rubripirellula sp.]|nr:ABC transporter ATP-binding protein [Rubripirellula sp.]MDB4338929.1 ABC transporter ATP-binding protein [Rubripirellula sp.]